MSVISGVHKPRLTAIDFIRYIGPGLIVTVGFIDPGNWASNIAAGSSYGYLLLWMVTLSTLMLIFLQHNAAHLGIVTGKCLSEATSLHMKPWARRLTLWTAVAASVSTALAEVLGGAIALNMLFRIPIRLGALLVMLGVICLLFTNSYRKTEKIIIGFVSIIGLSFIAELCLVHLNWTAAAKGLVVPAFPKGSMPIIMSVLGAVVMPHNLFLHSEIIQSRQWNLQDESVIQKQLKYEFADTLFSMIVGWAINAAMIIVAAATFFQHGTVVNDLGQAQELLRPLLGKGAALIFAIALLFAGISSSVTAGMAGGSIFAGLYSEPYDIADSHTKTGILVTLVCAVAAILFIKHPFDGLIYSQMLLSVQLPITIFAMIFLTSSRKVMGKFANSAADNAILWIIGIIVTLLNVALLVSMIRGS